MATDLTPTYQAAGQEWNVDPALLQAIAGQETGGSPSPNTAVSPKGAVGRMQIMPGTGQDMGVTDPTDPTQSIYAGAKYLSQMLDRYKSPDLAVAAYNAGPQRVDDYLAGRGALPNETLAYVPGVTARYQAIKTPATPTPPTPAVVDDPFTAALKSAQHPPATPAETDPFTQALTTAQKAIPPAPPAAPQVDTFAITAADSGIPMAQVESPGNHIPDPVAGAANVAREAVSGAAAGFGSQPLGLSPQSDQALVNAGIYNGPNEYNPLKGINRAVIGGGAALGDLALRTGGALLGAYQGGVSQAGSEIGQPQLGRDLAALPEAFPTGDAGGGTAIPHSATEGAPVANPLDASHQAALDNMAAESAARRPDVLAPSAASVAASPAFVPPGATVPLKQRILDLIAADDKVAASRPAFVPPDAAQPPNPLSTPAARAVQAADANPLISEEPTPASAPQPQSVGAAASRDMTAPEAIPAETPEQKLTNLGKSITQSAEDRAGPQQEDHTVYVPGVERPLAARVFSPQNSLDDKTLRATDPEYRTQQEAIERRNNQTMVDLLGNDAGDDNALKQAHDDRDEVAPPAQQLFENEKPVDASPLVQHIDSVLAGPDGKREAVVRTLTSVKKSLFDADGNIETLPSQLYGARKNITDLLKKGVGDGADDARASKSILSGLLDKMDPIINDGAPKYQTYLDQFHEASQPINQMEFLQKYQTGQKKLTNVHGYLELRKVQKMLDDVYQGQKAGGINLAKSLTNDQVQNIVNVRNELAAQALKDRLAAVKGSDTTQMMNRTGILGDGPLGTAVKGAAEMGAHALLFHTTGGLGNAVMALHRGVVRPAREAARASRQENALVARKAQLLGTQPNPLQAN